LMKNFKSVWAPTLNSQAVNMDIVMESDKELMFRVFPIDIDSIFNNLIANSLDAFRRNDANDKRNIFIELFEKDNNLVMIYRDSGPGLNDSIKNPYDIFEPFVTTKIDKNGEEIGTGLGMWIVKSTIDEYKGKISISNNLSEGFGIEINFPLKKDEGLRRI
jgi:C4-dicarboxylate-specific signal transduction histidine kinase